MSPNEISADDLKVLIDSNVPITLIDVRTAGEFGATHIDKSRNIPVGSKDLQSLKNEDLGHQIVFICQGGTRAKSACQEFDIGTDNAGTVLAGGLNSWEKKGYPVVRGEGAISMERQVRITAGLLVFLGSTLGIIFSSTFLIIPIFVGCGLVYSGITNTCGMASILAYMPWNSKSCCKNNSCKMN